MGECPVWEERESALVYVDINSQKVCRWSPLTNEVQSVSVGKSLNSPLHPGSLLHPPLSIPPSRSPAAWWSPLLSMGPHTLSSHYVLLSTVWPEPGEQRRPCSGVEGHEHVALAKPQWAGKFHLGPAEEKVQS